MEKIYGYARISTKKQSIERQKRNIKDYANEAIIIEETFSGTSKARPKLNKLLKQVKTGDTIVFDSVSRFSRDAKDGFKKYQELYNKGINLVFLKEPHINSDVFKKATADKIKLTGDQVDIILNAVNEYLMLVAKEQIKIAFEQAEKEVTDLRQRTKEGIETARLNGKKIGNEKGAKLVTKKSIVAKESIKKHNKTFGGSLNDKETMELTGLARNTFYKYKRELIAEQ